ncbi:hypothetical protein BD626DRAFT_583982 [Schizophyllum amplum]|uniref:Uncharacterized protein n=1 Tax=Schizophyllum amplum TaxID=97359 RepID=A0A550CCZ9_9AGAR|nr:hypothetical protein BD626DRAFT_583982 [Auriculariopsis ampla]
MQMNSHYQEISHALHPVGASSGYPPNMYQRQMSPMHRDEEEEDDEGMIEEQLHHKEIERHTSGPSTPPPATTAAPQQMYAPPDSQQPEVPAKRRPGRPRGSKTKKKNQQQEPGVTPAPVAVPVPEVNAQNQQYYEFQWRVLNLCAEFYGAAEELLVSGIAGNAAQVSLLYRKQPPLVVAQCYQMSPANPVDPMNMVKEAKRICDTLIQNPTRLLTQPPPHMYPTLPMFYAPQPPPAGSPSGSAPPAASISTPQSFVVPMGSQPSTFGQYAGSQPTQYQYPMGTPFTMPLRRRRHHNHHRHQFRRRRPRIPPRARVRIREAGRRTRSTAEAPARGEQSALVHRGQTWDWVIQQYGPTRTRHQILIKATALGLKESSGKGPKRQRRNSDGEYQPLGQTTGAAPASAGPSQMKSPTNQSTPSDSPAIQHPPPPSAPQQPPPLQSQNPPSSQQASRHIPQLPPLQSQPPPSGAPLSASASSSSRSMPWPMPTVASTTTSPIISTAATPDPQRASMSNYYHPRPQGSDSPSNSTQVGGGYSYTYRLNGGRENGR